MRIFFGFSNTDLSFTGFLQNFTQGHCKIIFSKDHFNTFESFVVSSHGHIEQVKFFHVLFREILLCKCFGNFATTVGTEIKANNHIAFFDCCNGLSICINLNYRFQKLISYIITI
ncbi:hypothetical protein D3C78_1322050 [compost metagenome]